MVLKMPLLKLSIMQMLSAQSVENGYLFQATENCSQLDTYKNAFYPLF